MALPPVEDPRPIWAYAAMLVGMPLLFEHEQGRRKQQETPQAIEPRLEGEKTRRSRRRRKTMDTLIEKTRKVQESILKSPARP